MIDAMKRWGFVLCVLVGCSSHAAAPPKTAENATPPKSQCAQVADHLVSEMTGAKQASPEEVDPYRQLIEKRCDADNWSAELQKCLLASKTLQENKPCQPMFTDEQNANLERDGTAAENATKSTRHTNDTDDDEDDKAGKAAPPPPGAPAERSRAPAPKGGRKTGDPCGGGQ
jgi:hypothetical protein